MPRIQFTRDVANADGTGVLYAAGYEADVGYAAAQKWLRSGDAIDLNAPPRPPEPEAEAVAEEEPSGDAPAEDTSSGRRGKRTPPPAETTETV